MAFLESVQVADYYRTAEKESGVGCVRNLNEAPGELWEGRPIELIFPASFLDSSVTHVTCPAHGGVTSGCSWVNKCAHCPPPQKILRS